jgi:periplasmic protein TonB
MFEQTFVTTGKTRKGWTVVLSFLAQMLAIGVLILIPLIYTDTLPRATLTSFLVAPPPPPPPPPPPAAAPPKVVHIAPRQFDAGRLMAPKTIPKQIAMIKEEELPPANAGVVGGVPGGVPGGTPGGVIGGIIGSVPTAAPPPPPPPKPKAVVPQRIRVGGQVAAASLIRKVMPVYPTLAKQARIQGTVRFQAVIGKDGRIQDLQLISGHPLLVGAAEEAVKQWLYRPTLLNGEPVEVITQIDVNFTLSS